MTTPKPPPPQTSTSTQTLVQRALGGHAAIGLLASALLYLIALSGSVIVIHDRWQRWEQPQVPEMATLSPAAAQAAMIAGLAQGKNAPTAHLTIRLPTAGLPRATVTTDAGTWYVDAQGRAAARQTPGWTEFVVALHEYLHLPQTWGLMLVGALGVALAALAVTGVLAHPRILRDAFRLRPRHPAQIAHADWHNRLGVWTLPFALAVATTGAFLGMSGIGATVLARAYTGGDLAKVYAPVFGGEAAPDTAPAPLPDVAAALRTLARRVPAAMPTYVIVHDPRTRGQHIQIFAELPRRLIYGESYQFDAAGRFTGRAGMSDGALGQQAAASAYNLHFGNYGGLVVEIAYVGLGLALCVITATGTTLWLAKRRRRGLGGSRLAAGWAAIVWGTPLLLIGTLWLRVIGGPAAPVVAVFWLGLAALLVVAAVAPARIRAGWLQRGTFVGLAVTGVAHAAVYGSVVADVVAIDAALVVIGVAALAALRTGRRA